MCFTVISYKSRPIYSKQYIAVVEADIMNQLIRDGTLEGWRYFDSPRRFGSDYGTQKGWERIADVNEGMSTECGFSQMTTVEDIPF